VITQRNIVIGAIVVVVALLLWSWLKKRGQVLDAGNDAQASGLFDQLNPTIPGTQGGDTGFVPPQLAGKNGLTPPIVDFPPRDVATL
jgi:hypothetical protein